MKDEVQKVIAESVDILRSRNDLAPTSREIEITIPKRKEFGDFSTNIAIILANELSKKPREVAELIINNISLEGKNLFKKIDIAGPGFINFFINEKAVTSRLTEIERLGENYGKSNLGMGERVLVEFVSANPTGYLHMGHARNAAVGDAISNILNAVGFDVRREFYVNDTGRQMELLGVSVYRRYEELFGIKKELPEDGYFGEYITDIAKEIREKKGGKLISEGVSEQEAMEYCKEHAKERLLQEIKKDLNDFGVIFDYWYSEQNELHKIRPELKDGNRMGAIRKELMQEDALEEKDVALWFKASNFGEPQDWVLIRKDGSPTYFFSDIAYHYDKIQRGFKRLIDVWGADHYGHISRLLAALRALKLNDFSLEVVLIQFVRLIKDRQEVSMSKRAGSYLTMREVMQEVGRDVMRFFLLMRSSESHLDFDLDLAKRESSENPVYYIQYAYARIGSVFEKAKERELSPSKEFLNLLNLPEEIDIIKKLLTFPELVRDCAVSLSPHKLAFYLQDIASDFHVYYNKSRIISDAPELSVARLYFVNSIRTVIRNGLKLLGISTPERM
ncbi:MAG: arginine--tRNA ligase [Candidatus Dadabacteria bacterium]|nr:arginine--tRNA ligase [Candidatus Dadabacteria bacterium]